MDSFLFLVWILFKNNNKKIEYYEQPPETRSASSSPAQAEAWKSQWHGLWGTAGVGCQHLKEIPDLINGQRCLHTK